ncbi:ssDNA endodeoxyribonuclease RAD2 [Aspergillus candidus]|uniref:PIN domain-like protein n=1 Tax=Aspergillus candidus TaxID=41067 RepID=A0A2I2F5R4_ASPCN|nr:PIN domain-like protein [Aspergillus candidus]PLB35990.1 PIN domain-like protein [Aspergillus candidus]
MGVHGLWTVVQPCARPIKLETLNKKRLAVDASIWIYQFLKAVRDKEGNALRNAHIVGFFRRVCKLLYFGIKPVFVFDGDAPLLKRQTIAGRKKRREGRREDAVRTAGKLLAVQLQRSAEEEAARRRNAPRQLQEEAVPDNPVYVEETFMTEQEKKQSRLFRKKDAYHLPDMQVSLEEMGAPNDPRIMSREELEEYARRFHQGEDINLYDFSKIDFDSPFFMSLPATDRYNILNAARLRSRLRMGYSKEQLDQMFPDRMAFSKFQIDRVKERNDLTQRLMNLNGMNGEDAFFNSGQRIAGERGKEYVLVKDSTIEGGWVLGVVGNKEEGREHKPIDVDQYGERAVLPDQKAESDDDDDDFEDVPVEGLNRLPRLPFLRQGALDESIQQQLHQAASQDLHRDVEDDSLFVQDKASVRAHDIGLFSELGDNEDDDLQKAIQMSLEPTVAAEQHDKDMPDIPVNRDAAPLLAPDELPSTLDSGSDDDFDFTAALAQSRRTKKEPSHAAKNNPFDGPLPFESIKLGQTDKPRESTEFDQTAGGFVKESAQPPKEDPSLPPWFSGAQPDTEFVADKVDDTMETRHSRVALDHSFVDIVRSDDVIGGNKPSRLTEVIDLESDDNKEIEVAPSPTEEKIEERVTYVEPPVTQPERPEIVTKSPSRDEPAGDVAAEGPHLKEDGPRVNFLAERVHEPSPSPEFEDVAIPPPDVVDPVPATTIQPPEPIDADQADGLMEDEFSDPEDEDLLRQLAAEGEEHVRFAATLNSAAPVEQPFDYEQELKQLRSQQKKDRRDADEVSQIMVTECQQLLALFGLPYITAPMEAEAQCAELVSLGLVDGVITDDSDIFLFGGTRVYKNMFNQSKFVECYLTSDLEKEYALHRQKLISFAHLLGSDYTEGIPGIGPVTALEIITEFSSLEDFREWWTRVQTGATMSEDAHAAFYKRFKKNATKIFLPPAFPDTRVEQAYLQPEVDADPSSFQWGVPDLHGLRNFLMSTIGWSQERTDEVLVPVIRDMNQREQEGTQSNITAFFSGPQGAGAFAPRARGGGPSRMQKALSRLRRDAEAGRKIPSESDPPGERVDEQKGVNRDV